MKYMKVSIKYTNYVYLESNGLKFPKSGGRGGQCNHKMYMLLYVV